MAFFVPDLSRAVRARGAAPAASMAASERERKARRCMSASGGATLSAEGIPPARGSPGAAGFSNLTLPGRSPGSLAERPCHVVPLTLACPRPDRPGRLHPPPRPDPPPPRGAAAKPRAEAELRRTTSSKRGASGRGLESAAVRPREAQEHLRLPGWVAVPQGSEVTLTAPVAGYVRQPEGGG